MKYAFIFIFSMITFGLSAQNVGIGTQNPINKLHIKVDTQGILPILRLGNAHNNGDASILLRAAQSSYSFGLDASAGDVFSFSKSIGLNASDRMMTLSVLSSGRTWLDLLGHATMDSIILTEGAGMGRILMSDAFGKGTWINPGTINANAWKMGGNTISDTDFIGPTNLKKFRGKVAGEIAFMIDPDGDNTTFGINAGDSLTTGYNNTFIGELAGKSNMEGSFNTFVGGGAGGDNQSASRNTVFGYAAMSHNETGERNTYVGFFAGLNLKGSYNVALGSSAAQGLTGGDQDYNIAIGSGALGKIFQSDYNIAIGDSALHYLTEANNNIAIGKFAGRGEINAYPYPNVMTGTQNIFIGNKAGFIFSSGERNVVLGAHAGKDINEGSRNILLGDSVQLQFPGQSDFMNLGNSIFAQRDEGQVGIGVDEPIQSLHIGDLGASDGLRLEGSANTNQVRIYLDNNDIGGREYVIQSTGGIAGVGQGKFAIRDVFAFSNRFVLDEFGRVGIGTENPISQFQVGEMGDGTTATANAWNLFSDQRLKQEIETFKQPIETINQLRGVTYEWRKTGEPTIGFIAQEVEEVLPDIVYTDANGYKSMDYTKIVPILVEANKELAKKLEAQNELIHHLNKRLTLLENN